MLMSGIYSTNKIKNLNQLNDVNITDISNNDIISYNSTSGLWENKSDFITDEIDCRVLRVSQTADIGGRLAVVGVASLVDDEFIFQNGISNLGDVVYIDNVNNRVGINISNPEEDLEVDGSIQIDSANVSRLKFQQSGPTPHAEAEIDGEEDGTNGGQLEFFTKVDGGSVTKKMSINNAGAIGLGATPDYGTSGSVLTSNGSTALPTWNEPYYFSATSDGANGGAFRITTVDDSRQPLLHNSALGTGGAWTTNIETTGKNQFDETTAQWTCPKTGIYNITIRSLMNIDPFPNGNIGEVYLYLFKDTGGGFTTVIGFASRTDETESGTEAITTITLQITGLFSLNEGDKVRPEVMKKSDDTQQLKCGRFGYDPQFSIHRIA